MVDLCPFPADFCILPSPFCRFSRSLPGKSAIPTIFRLRWPKRPTSHLQATYKPPTSVLLRCYSGTTPVSYGGPSSGPDGPFAHSIPPTAAKNRNLCGKRRAIDWRGSSAYRPVCGRNGAVGMDGRVLVIREQMSFLPLVRIWLWVSVLASVAGGLLSALGQLNEAGYAVLGVAGAAGLWFGRKALGLTSPRGLCHWKKARARFRRWLPDSFAVLALLVLLGGALYPPTTHTAMTYRTPRVLHWLAEGHWHWIHTPNYRMNNRCCGLEWLTAPVLLFIRSDRPLFLINFMPFLLMPGLTFSVFTRLGVRPRVAWHWMWLLPTGYNFLLQAGSLANDTFPTVYALAAVDFGLRAWVSRHPSDLWYSLLAAALLTGAKASNLPLLLPWAILVCALWPLLTRRPVMSFLVIVLAATASALPTLVLNVRYCGDWSGLVLEHAGMNMKNPFVGIWGNALLLLSNNFVPTFFPLAGWWNQSALSILPHALTAPMMANFEEGFMALGEMPTEDWVGVGCGLSVLLAASLLASCRAGSPANKGWAGSGLIPRGVRWGVLVAPWLSLLAYGMKSIG